MGRSLPHLTKREARGHCPPLLRGLRCTLKSPVRKEQTHVEEEKDPPKSTEGNLGAQG